MRARKEGYLAKKESGRWEAHGCEEMYRGERVVVEDGVEEMSSESPAPALRILGRWRIACREFVERVTSNCAESRDGDVRRREGDKVKRRAKSF